MGSCLGNSRKRTFITANQGHTYPRSSTVTIKIKSHNNKISGFDPVSFKLSQPILCNSNLITLNNRSFWVSQCVLPGLDPRGQMKKQCQDLCFYKQTQDSFLAILFDGHGSQGASLVKYCKSQAQSYFQRKQTEQKENPENFLTNLSIFCDQSLKKPTCRVDPVYSGTTGVFVYLMNDMLYSASVGDSRAIISSATIPETLPAPPANLGEDRHILDSMKYRNSLVKVPLQAIQLTRDQKPEDPQELERILKCGGRVQRLQDENGHKVGPYRVWELRNNTPGLAMSRSIGDQAGTKLGVIATPVTTRYQISEQDYFIVIASDGVWDVLENHQVVSFVESYREKCRKGVQRSITNELVRAENACIAQLLCEEARFRWYAIVQQEDVLIDDISCVIIQLIGENAPIQIMYQRSQSIVNQDPYLEIHEENEEVQTLRKVPTISDTNATDPRRNSVVSVLHLDIGEDSQQMEVEGKEIREELFELRRIASELPGLKQTNANLQIELRACENRLSEVNEKLSEALETKKLTKTKINTLQASLALLTTDDDRQASSVDQERTEELKKQLIEKKEQYDREIHSIKEQLVSKELEIKKLKQKTGERKAKRKTRNSVDGMEVAKTKNPYGSKPKQFKRSSRKSSCHYIPSFIKLAKLK